MRDKSGSVVSGSSTLNDEQYCFDLVKQHDQDSYLSTLLAPIEKRRFLLAIYAFQIEIEHCITKVSEAPIGEIRLQWWIDTFDIIFSGRTAEHPVARELCLAIAKHDLPKHLFVNLIYTRRDDLYSQPLQTKADLINYCKTTKGAIMDLSLRTMLDYDALAFEEIIESCAIAHGICSILSHFPIYLYRKRCMVPVEVLENSRLSEQSVFLKQPPQELSLVFVQMRHIITEQMTNARNNQNNLPKEALPVFYPTSLTDLYVQKLAHKNHVPTTMIVECSQLSKQWHLFKKSWLEKF